MPLHQYQVIGRHLPTAVEANPPLFRMRLFAKNTVVAKSRFWYFLGQLHKLKRATGEIVAVNEIREKNNRIVRNYGVTIKYNSRSGTHNMYKEYRDTSLTGAVEQMCTPPLWARGGARVRALTPAADSEMAGRHRARFSSIVIVDTCIVPAGVKLFKRFKPLPDEVNPQVPVHAIRSATKAFLTSRIKFPLPHRIQRPTSKAFRTTFKATRPTTFNK